MSTSPLELAKRYWIDDISSAASAGTRLSNLLGTIANRQPLTAASKTFLASRGLGSLLDFVNGNISEDQFNQRASAEREQRIAAELLQQLEIDAQKKADQAMADAREAAMWARLEAERIQRESDPKFIARKKNQELRRKCGVDVFVEEHHFKRLMSILRKLDAGSRMPELDIVWLKTEGRDYLSQEILHAHHRLEADFCLAEYKRTSDPWLAVNASGHLRKCDASQEASDLLAAIPTGRLQKTKLKSAALTTHGGAMRDLGRYIEALKMGEEAHALLPDDYRPCTLLGAVHMEMGEIGIAHEWFRKAEERGATPDNIESELRSLLVRMTTEKREEAIGELLRTDPVRYRWLQKRPVGKERRRG
ncbi:hypothetical protein V2S84_11395 [Azotobacter chroococcum]|nr:hypothetical protein [Azotobacter chroococcum]